MASSVLTSSSSEARVRLCSVTFQDWILGKVVDESRWGVSVREFKVADHVFAHDAILIADSLKVLM